MNIMVKLIENVAKDVENEAARNAGEEIAEEVVSVSEEEFFETTLNYIKENGANFEIIKGRIKSFIEKLKNYDETPSKGSSLELSKRNLEIQKEFIYKDFFEIQNLINEFLGQKIEMTYVHIDENGRREIRISENDIGHLQVTEARKNSWKNTDTALSELDDAEKYAKLTYVVEDHYTLLENSLPEEDNDRLQSAATEVDTRYRNHKKKILWQWVPSSWKGYKLSNKGPINEAFVNMYVHNIKLTSPLEKDINDFMLDTSYGAIKADATKGFLIGDVAKNGVQYAVKGIFGSPQGTKDVRKAFEIMAQDNFSEESFAAFIKKFTYDELHKGYKPQIKELTQRSINATARFMSNA